VVNCLQQNSYESDIRKQILEDPLRIEEAFGIVIRRLRKERHLSQEKLSEISCLDRTFISNIEGGKQQPSLVTIFALAAALNVNASTIVFETEFIVRSNHPDSPRKSFKSSGIDWISRMGEAMTTSCNCYNGEETILVADDELQLREMMSSFLASCGYRVIVAEDGDDALHKFLLHAAEVKLVILDVVMPKKDGIATYREMKGINPTMPVIFISGYHSHHLKEEECAALLQKPFSPIELLERIRFLLDTAAV